MIKLFITFIFAFVIVLAYCRQSSHRHNKIDDIRSVKDIEAIFYPLVSWDTAYFHIDDSLNFSDIVYGKHRLSNKPFRMLQTYLHALAWTKADFDNNGYTDLVFTGHDHDPYIGCIMDSGENRFFIKWITRRSFQNAVLPLVTYFDNTPALLHYHYPNNEVSFDESIPIVCDTLVYHFGDFVEYNANHKKYNVLKIKFNTSLCLGSCPDFTLEVNKNRSALLKAEYYNTDSHGQELKGNYTAKINRQVYDDIINLLDYIDFEKLGSDYNVPWSDCPTSILTVTYNSGKTKTITDYGLLGTFGLNNLYNKLFALRFNQHWQRAAK